MAGRVTKLNLRAGLLTRRDLLRAGGVLIPASAVIPGFLSGVARAQSTSFNYYISPSGSDSNAGTMSSPWAITALNTKQSVYAGKRLGLLSGTYDISGFKPQTDGYSPVLQIKGGSSGSPTVIQAVSQRGAIIKANNGSSYPFVNCPIIGDYGSSSKGYITIDGIVFTGGGSKTIYLGDYGIASTGSRWAGYAVQNCEITGMNCMGAAAGGNFSCIELAGGSGAYIGNNSLHDNIGQAGKYSADHWSGTLQWYCDSTVYEYNSLVNSGGIYGKESGQRDTQIRYNYIDNSNWSICSGVQDFAADSSVTSGTFRVHHNVIIAAQNDLRPTLGGYATQTMEFYNNTLVVLNSAASQGMITRIALGKAKFYNNIIYNQASGDHGLVTLNIGAPGIVNYNLYFSTTDYEFNTFSSLTDTLRTGEPSLSAWQTAMGAGVDTHSVSGKDPLFVRSGSGANYYKLQGSSPAVATGSSNGTGTGSAVDIGAWGNGAPSTIGSGVALVRPEPPANISVS